MSTLKPLWLLALAMVLPSCTKRAFNSASKTKSDSSSVPFIPPVAKDTEAFSWTSSSQAISDPAAYIRANLADALSKTKALAGPGGRINGNAEAGLGFYTAGDPFNSMDYGEILVVVPIRSGTSDIAVARHSRGDVDTARAAVVSDASGVFYSFGGISFSGNNAIVFRTEPPLDLTRARAIDSRTPPRPIGNHEPLSKKDGTPLYESVLTQFGDHRPLISFIASNVKALGSVAPEKSEETLVLVGARSDASQPGSGAAKVFSEMKSDAAAKTYPTCDEIFRRDVMVLKMNTPEAKASRCLDIYFGALHNARGTDASFQLPPGNSASLTPVELSAFLEAAGLLKHEDDVGSFESIANRVLAQNRSAAAPAWSLAKAILEIQTEFSVSSFSNWGDASSGSGRGSR